MAWQLRRNWLVLCCLVVFYGKVKPSACPSAAVLCKTSRMATPREPTVIWHQKSRVYVIIMNPQWKQSECKTGLEHQEGGCQNSGGSDRDGTELVHEAVGWDLQCAISPIVNRLSCVEEGTSQLGLTHGTNEYHGTQIQKAHGCPVQDAIRAIFFPGRYFVSHACMPRYIYFTPELFSRHCSALLSPLMIIIVLVLFLVCVCIVPNTIRSGVLRTELLQLWKRLNLEGATLMGFFQMWVPRLSSDV